MLISLLTLNLYYSQKKILQNFQQGGIKKNFLHNKDQFSAFTMCAVMKMFEQDPVLLQNHISAHSHVTSQVNQILKYH